MYKGKTESKVVRRKKRPEDKEELVITVANGKTIAKGTLPGYEIFAFIGGGIPELIEDLIMKLDSNDESKVLKILALTMVKSKVNDLLGNISNDSDDDD